MLKQIFTENDIDSLLNRACAGKYELKDRYLVSQLAYVPLSLTEHNLLRLHQLISDKGEIYRKWVLPAAYSRNKERIIEVPEVFCQALEHYLNWYEQQEVPVKYRHNLGTYRGFSEYAPALLNDRLNEFAMSERTVKSGINKQPTNLRTKVNTLLKKAGLDWATAKTFEDSLIIHLARNVDHGVVADLFGYASRQVVTDKYNGNLLQISEAINNVYSRIKVTGH
jgi:integrase|tara:strand:- start:5530 stop:6201 length:672 start_codon:yes stop_codon:yes gene_type:complete